MPAAIDNLNKDNISILITHIRNKCGNYRILINITTITYISLSKQKLMILLISFDGRPEVVNIVRTKTLYIPLKGKEKLILAFVNVLQAIPSSFFNIHWNSFRVFSFMQLVIGAKCEWQMFNPRKGTFHSSMESFEGHCDGWDTDTLYTSEAHLTTWFINTRSFDFGTIWISHY